MCQVLPVLYESKVIVTKNEEYCNAERVLGASSLRIMFSHVLPNTVSEVVVYATLSVGSAIISEASLSFLGLGILIPTPSWGNILRAGRGCLTTGASYRDFLRTPDLYRGNRL